MSGQRILLVDDEPMVLRIMQMALEKGGYMVDTCSNGAKALEKLRDEQPDILITDIEMPVMTGQQLCIRIAEEFPNRKFKIIVSTSLTGLEHRDWSKKLHNLTFLEKPLSARRLLTLLAEHFENAGVAEPAGSG